MVSCFLITIFTITFSAVSISQEFGPFETLAGPDYRAAKELLESGTKPDEVRTPQGDTPLMVAAQSGNKRIAKLLIEHGADVNAKNKEDMTPLMFAAKANRKPVVELFIKNGAQIDEQDKNGKTALIHAATHGHTASV